MATSEAQPDSGVSTEGRRSERELRWQAREIVRGVFETSPQFERLVDETVGKLRQLQEDVDATIPQLK